MTEGEGLKELAVFAVAGWLLIFERRINVISFGYTRCDDILIF